MGPIDVLYDIKEQLWADLKSRLCVNLRQKAPRFESIPRCPEFTPTLFYNIYKKNIEIVENIENNFIAHQSVLKNILKKIESEFDDETTMKALCVLLLSHEYVHAIHHFVLGDRFRNWYEENAILSKSQNMGDRLILAKNMAWSEGIATSISMLMCSEKLKINQELFLAEYQKLYLNEQNREKNPDLIVYGVGAKYFLNKKRIDSIAKYLELPAQQFPETVTLELKKRLS